MGVVAVDPTSPFTGGAILGDRVRMQAHAGDAGVFIRSMATRGHLGGLAERDRRCRVLLDAAGRDCVIIETVGVGQAEVDIVRTADVCVVVLVPGTGDEVQALKAGIMEIADMFVVNKADREGADRMVAAVETVLGLAAAERRGLAAAGASKTEATRGVGIDALVEAVDRFRADARRRDRTPPPHALHGAAARADRVAVHGPGRGDDRRWRARVARGRVAAREIDPYAAARLALARVCPDSQ